MSLVMGATQEKWGGELRSQSDEEVRLGKMPRPAGETPTLPETLSPEALLRCVIRASVSNLRIGAARIQIHADAGRSAKVPCHVASKSFDVPFAKRYIRLAAAKIVQAIVRLTSPQLTSRSCLVSAKPYYENRKLPPRSLF